MDFFLCMHVYVCACVRTCVCIENSRTYAHKPARTGYTDLPSRMATQSSALYANNIAKYLLSMGPKGESLSVSAFLPPPRSLFSVSVSDCLSTYAFRASFVRFAHVYPPTSFANPACTRSRMHAKAHPRKHTQANSSSTTRTTQCVAPWSFVRAHSHGPPPLHLPRRHLRLQRRSPRKSPRRPRRLPPLLPPPHADRYACVVAAVPVPAGGRVCACAGGCA